MQFTRNIKEIKYIRLAILFFSAVTSGCSKGGTQYMDNICSTSGHDQRGQKLKKITLSSSCLQNKDDMSLETFNDWCYALKESIESDMPFGISSKDLVSIYGVIKSKGKSKMISRESLSSLFKSAVFLGFLPIAEAIKGTNRLTMKDEGYMRLYILQNKNSFLFSFPEIGKIYFSTKDIKRFDRFLSKPKNLNTIELYHLWYAYLQAKDVAQNKNRLEETWFKDLVPVLKKALYIKRDMLLEYFAYSPHLSDEMKQIIIDQKLNKIFFKLLLEGLDSVSLKVLTNATKKAKKNGPKVLHSNLNKILNSKKTAKKKTLLAYILDHTTLK